MESVSRARNSLPWHYWPMTFAGLLWNAWGCWLFWLTVTRDPETMAAQRPAFIDWIDSFPPWVTVAWLAGVSASLLGSVAMVGRSRWAIPAFAVSLGGALASYLYQFTHLPAGLDGVPAMAAVALTVTVLIAVQLVYAASAWRACWFIR